MTGLIQKTHGRGGYIKYAGEEIRPLIAFRWSDTELDPNSCGHDTPVEFDGDFFGGRLYAINVRRTDNTHNE
jgi:hypothetical protein